jgi:SAM-dependent methyltransferase
MKLSDLTQRLAAPAPWSEGEKIPWDDPDFSRRMLAEHLSDYHDRASRRAPTIDVQVAWIHETLLGGRPTRILDLGCGPGLYASRLAALGHAIVGIDFSPASIEYAREQSGSASDDLRFELGDVRTADYGGPFGCIMLLFGEANAFRTSDLATILEKAHEALEPGGRLLVEAHEQGAVRAVGTAAPSWHTAERGLFGDAPYLCLRESFWDDELSAATERWQIVDLASADVTPMAASMQAYTEDAYRKLFDASGFEAVELQPGMGDAVQDDLQVWLARKPG